MKRLTFFMLLGLLVLTLSACQGDTTGSGNTYSSNQGGNNNQSQQGSGSSSSDNQKLGNQTKSANCRANGPLQDKQCTPGAVFPNATKAQICQQGYSKSVRNVPVAEKNQVYAEYGIAHHTSGEYEVDHLISLELGGSNDLANLWPEAASPTPGFHEKDKVENYLHDQVCSGAISLREAQREIATNWLDAYKRLGSK